MSPTPLGKTLCVQVPVEDWHGFYKPLWLASALLNSSYSYYWDIERDWDIQWFTAPGAEEKFHYIFTCEHVGQIQKKKNTINPAIWGF